MARARRGRTTRARRTPAERSRRFADQRLEAPTIDWGSPPEQFRFPESRVLKTYPIEDLNDLLMRFNIVEPWPQARAAAAGYVQRMSAIPPGSEAFKDEIDRLLDFESKRGSLGATRRAYREYSLVDALDGDRMTPLIWISDGDDGTCERCGARGGDIGTVAYHSSRGLPGPAVCLGGDYCRCQLVPID